MLTLRPHFKLKGHGRHRGWLEGLRIVEIVVIGTMSGLVHGFKDGHRRSFHRIVVDVVKWLRTLHHHGLRLKFRKEH